MLFNVVIVLLLQAQTVTVTPDPSKPAIQMDRVVAERKFTALCQSKDDTETLAALAIALDKFPDWPKLVMDNNRDVCAPKTPDAQ